MRLTASALTHEQRPPARALATLSTLDALCLDLRGVQLRADRVPDACSVATARVSYEPTWHARNRLLERGVTERQVQACLKYGVSSAALWKRVRHEHKGIVVIATHEKVVITTWRTRGSSSRLRACHVGSYETRAVAQLAKMCEWAFRVWRWFPNAPRKHVAWLLERAPHALVPPPRDARRRLLRLHFGAWRLMLEIEHNKRVCKLLQLCGIVARLRARATVVGRAAFAHWRAHAAREAAFNAATALTSRYVAAYARCDARRALRRWRSGITRQFRPNPRSHNRTGTVHATATATA
jgi:hypothetical protein